MTHYGQQPQNWRKSDGLVHHAAQGMKKLITRLLLLFYHVRGQQEAEEDLEYYEITEVEGEDDNNVLLFNFTNQSGDFQMTDRFGAPDLRPPHIPGEFIQIGDNPPVHKCPKNWHNINDQCFLFEVKQLSYYQAEAKCKSLNSELVKNLGQNLMRWLSKSPVVNEFWAMSWQLQKDKNQCRFMRRKGRPHVEESSCFIKNYLSFLNFLT